MIRHVLIGIGMGLFIATFGYAKDSLYEPFSLRKYSRSVFLGCVGGFLCYVFFPDVHFVLIVSFVGLVERLTVEVWKALFRRQRPSKFKDSRRDTLWLIRKIKGEATRS